MRALPGGSMQDWVAHAYADTPQPLWKLAERSSAPVAKVVNAALTPIERKASSNARRLARTPLTPRQRAAVAAVAAAVHLSSGALRRADAAG